MEKPFYRKLTNADEILEAFLENGSALLHAAKQLSPEIDTGAVTFRILPDHWRTTGKKLLDQAELLESTLNIREEEVRRKRQFSLYPDAVDNEEFISFLALLADISDTLEDVRFMIFYTLDQTRTVADVKIEQGKLFMKKGEYKAETNDEFYRRWLSEDPGDTDVLALWYEETLEASLYGDDLDARRRHIEMLPTLINNAKTQADALYARAMCAFLESDKASAINFLTRALAIEPKHFLSLEQLASEYFHLRDFASALPLYERAIALAADRGPHMQWKRLECMMALNNWNNVHAAIEGLIHATLPSDARRLVLQLNELRKFGRADLTIFGLRELIHKYTAMLSENNLILEESKEIEQGIVFARIYLAYTEASLEHFTEARAHLESLIKNDQWDHPEAHRALATVLLSQKDIDGLEKEVEILKVINNKHPDTYVLEGGLYMLMKQYDTALAAYQKAVKLDPTNCYSGYFGIGHALAWMRKDEEAIPYYRKSLEIYPKQPRCLSDLASSLSNIGEWSEAKPLLDQSITIDPDHYHPYYVHGCIAALEERYDESIEWLRKALARDPSIKDRLMTEPDLEKLRKLDEFHKLAGDV